MYSMFTLTFSSIHNGLFNFLPNNVFVNSLFSLPLGIVYFQILYILPVNV